MVCMVCFSLAFFDKLSYSKLGHVTHLVVFCFNKQGEVPPDICIRRDQLKLFLPPGDEMQVARSRCEWLLQVKRKHCSVDKIMSAQCVKD